MAMTMRERISVLLNSPSEACDVGDGTFLQSVAFVLLHTPPSAHLHVNIYIDVCCTRTSQFRTGVCMYSQQLKNCLVGTAENWGE